LKTWIRPSKLYLKLLKMPQNRIAIIGGRGTGKSTCFQAVVDELKKNHVPFAGFKTLFLPSGALWLEWINHDEENVLMGQKTGMRSMKPVLGNLDRIGERLLQMDVKSKIFVADEIGFLEQLSKSLQRGIYKAVTDAPFSFFTMKNVDYPFLLLLKNLKGLRMINLGGMDWQQKNEIPQGCLKMIQEYEASQDTKKEKRIRGKR